MRKRQNEKKCGERREACKRGEEGRQEGEHRRTNGRHKEEIRTVKLGRKWRRKGEEAT